MAKEDLKDRTKKFAIRVIKLANALPKTPEGNVIRYQLIKSGTSTAANYRASCRARSILEFIAKLGIVEEEADESAFWMEVIIERKLLKEELVRPLSQEANEILAIVVTSQKTARISKKIKIINSKFVIQNSSFSNLDIYRHYVYNNFTIYIIKTI